MQQPGLSRRTFLRRSAGAVGGLSVAAVFQNFLANPARASVFGPIGPVIDETTGLPLLRLPEGFRYISYGWTGEPLRGGDPTPPLHDGMAVCFAHGAKVILVRNHEVRDAGPTFGALQISYDPNGPGGCTNVAFNRKTGRWLDAWVSIAGCSTNCAGGPTTWQSWLTCEETMDGPSDGFSETHGWTFEVPALQKANPVPLKALGRFSHEAQAVGPSTGIVYETEDDRHTSGFYRFLPNRPNRLFGLEEGGELQMLKVVGVDNAELFDVVAGDEFDVEWVTIDGPALEVGEVPLTAPVGDVVGGSTSVASAVFKQGWEDKGAARFRRLEGCWAADNNIYFDDTEGGALASDTGVREGAVWCYDPSAEKLRCIYASPAQSVLDNPDNITVAPDGSLFLCEDGNLLPQRLQYLTLGGVISPFGENNIVIADGDLGSIPGGDYRGSEWAGATFEPAGEWLFVNIQTPGITFAITGPWPWL